LGGQVIKGLAAGGLHERPGDAKKQALWANFADGLDQFGGMLIAAVSLLSTLVTVLHWVK
jgi:hypothetical protein